MLNGISKSQLNSVAKKYRVPVQLVEETKNIGRLPVVNFAAGGIATPADAALMMMLGCDGIFVGSGIFKSQNPERMAKAIVNATTHYKNAAVLSGISGGLGIPMKGIEIKNLDIKLQERGW